MIILKDVCKTYEVGGEAVHALDHANMLIHPGEFVGIFGPSGSGKSTLMNIVGCLDLATSGTYLLDGQPIEDYSESELARIRNRKIGFIFQSFNLISKLTADEPTGNLDSRTSGEIMDIFHDLHSQGSTIVLITHDGDVAAQAARRIRILDGRVSEVNEP